MEIEETKIITDEQRSIQKPVDLVIFETRQKLQNVLNQSGLPISVLTYIAKEIFDMTRDTQVAYLQSLNIKPLKPLPKLPENNNINK